MSDFRQAAIDAILEDLDFDSVKELRAYVSKNKQDDYFYGGILHAINAVQDLPSAQPTLYGYDIKHLMLIAEVLRKENLPPERVTEALMDIGRIVSIVSDEFEESLREAMKQCKI